MNRKRKIWVMTAAIAVIVGLLTVSIPAEEKDLSEKEEETELEEVLARWDDPEVKKILERSDNRKWYSYEELYGKELDEEDKEYMRILERMEREGIDITEFFEEIEERTIGKYVEAQKRGVEYLPEEFDIVQFAKDFEKRKLREEGITGEEIVSQTLSIVINITN